MKETKRILIIEDHPSISVLLQKRLDKVGFETKVCEDAASATRALKTFQPDLILLDILLPKKNGLEWLRKVRKNKDKAIANVSVVVITNYPRDYFVDQAKELGVKRFVVKVDYSLDEIVDMVREMTK